MSNEVLITENELGMSDQTTPKTSSKKVKKIIADESLNFDFETFVNENEEAKKLSEQFFTINGKMYFYSKKHDKIDFITSNNQLICLIQDDYPNLVKQGFGKNGIERNLLIDNKFIEICKFLNTCKSLVRKDDFFQDDKLTCKKVDDTLEIKKNYINFKDIDSVKRDITEDEEKTIIDEYLTHFKELPEILEWVVSCRFTDNRRSSFLHLRLNAGFGKSFFLNLLKKLGIATECRYEDFKSPSSLSSIEFENNMALIIDEFTIFKKEFKTLTTSMILDSKNELRTEVPIYAKIFLSAEESVSFFGGVDAQISDRLNQINYDKGKLEELENYKKFGSDLYFLTVQNWVKERIITRLEYYKNLGKRESSILAIATLENFNKKHKLKSEDLISVIRKRFFEKLEEIGTSEHITNKIEKEIIPNLLFTKRINEKDSLLYIRNPKQTFELLLQTQEEGFQAKAKYKTDIKTILEVFGANELDNKVHRVNGKTTRGLKVDCNYINKILGNTEQEQTLINFENEQEEFKKILNNTTDTNSALLLRYDLTEQAKFRNERMFLKDKEENIIGLNYRGADFLIIGKTAEDIFIPF